MVVPAAFEIAYPVSRVSVPEARAILSPFLESAYHSGLSAYEFYHTVVAKSTVTMTTSDYFSWANSKYEKFDKATSQLRGDPLNPFLITELPQQKTSLPDRFWAKVEYETTLPSGESQKGYFTYGFEDKQSIADVENGAYDYLMESGSAPGGEVSHVQVTELYKQY